MHLRILVFGIMEYIAYGQAIFCYLINIDQNAFSSKVKNEEL